MHLPEYSGNSDWKGYLMQFQLLSRQYGWTGEAQRKRLISGLRGEALQYVAQLPEHLMSSLPSLLQALEQRFGDPVLPETYRASLMSLRKNPKESLREYEARVRQLMSKAYPGLEGADFYNTMSIEYLCNGLPDPNMAFDILVKKPRTLRQALDMIEWYECCRLNTRRRVGVRQIGNVPYAEEPQAAPAASHLHRLGENQRFVTEERLHQFGKDLQEKISESVNQAIIVQFQRALGGRLKGQLALPAPSHAERREVKDGKPVVPEEENPGLSSPANPGARPEGQCFRCRQPGHFARQCPNSYQVREIVTDNEEAGCWPSDYEGELPANEGEIESEN